MLSDQPGTASIGLHHLGQQTADCRLWQQMSLFPCILYFLRLLSVLDNFFLLLP